MGGLAIIASIAVGKGLSDPEGSFLGPSWLRLPLLLTGALLLDMLPRIIWYSKGRPSAIRQIVRDRLRTHWTRERLTLVALGIASFYVVYVSYRNLKSFLPDIIGATYDRELHLLDRALMFGHDPSDILHAIFGTSAHGLVPLLHLPLVPAAGAARGHGLGGVVAQPVLRLLVRDVAVHRLDPRHRVLLRAAHPGAGLRVRVQVLRPPQDPHRRPDVQPAVGSSDGAVVRRRRVDADRGRLREPALRDHVADRADDPVHAAVEGPEDRSSGPTSASPSWRRSTSAGTTSPTTSPA